MESRIQFRTLTAQEIDVRPTDTKVRGKATLLLYKNARVDMQILDDAVGQFGWQKRYEDLGGKVYCYIGIQHPETHEWIWKGDCGMESNIDAAKGEASDAAKRAAAVWGIGRELYNTPKVKVTNLPDSYYYNDKLTMTFKVKEIAFDAERRCTKLVIVDRFDKVVYDLNNSQPEKKQYKATPAEESNAEILTHFCKEQKGKDDTDLEDLTRFYKFYKEKAENWTGRFDVSTLYQRWQATAR